MDGMDDPATPSPRRRALRAARVVTLGLAMAAPGCYATHGPADPVHEAEVASDAGPGDSAVASAEICDSTGDWEAYQACCAENGWDWERGCMAWGPFVPPADGQVA